MYLIARRLVEFYIRRKFKVHIYNEEKIPPPKLARKGGFIIAANHQYYWDPPAIAAFVRGKFSFMAKAELFEKRFFGWLIRRCGAFPVTRGGDSEKALKKAFDDIKRGRIFVIFPEGTRSKDGSIGKGKSGVALIASMANAPVLPVCLMYGLNGEEKRLDFAVGDIIPASELRISAEKQDRKEIKAVTERIMGAIKGLQAQIFENVEILENAKSLENVQS